MAVLLQRDFTAANGTAWDLVGFRRVSGGAIDAVVASNQGACGSSGSARIYLVTGYAQETNTRWLTDLTWANPAGSSRVPILVTRYTEDGLRGYGLEVDSNIGTPRARLLRRDGAGGWTDLTGWVALGAFGITSATLLAGTTCELRHRNGTDQVELAGIVAGTEVVAFTDTSASRVEAGGTVGLGIDALSTTTDVLYDSCQVEDMEADYAGDPAQLTQGLALVVDGDYHAEADLLDAEGKCIVVVERARHAFDKDEQVTFRTPQRMDGADALLYPGAIVKVLWDGVVLAFGRIRPARRMLAPKEGRAYQLTGCRGLAADVLLRNSRTGAQGWQWNLPTTHADYVAAYANKTLAQALTQLAEEHVDGEDGLRAMLAAPPDEDTPLFPAADLLLLHTEVLPFLSVSGPDMVSAVEQLLAHTRFALFIDPSTREWRLRKRLAGTIHQVDLAVQGAPVVGEFGVDPDRNFNAVELTGSRPEVTETDLDNGVAEGRDVNNGLEPDWEPTLEAGWTAEKGKRNTDAGEVGSISGGGSSPTMTPAPPFTMDALEWNVCRMGFRNGAEAGEVYDVDTNTGLAFTLVGPWRNGGPAPGDLFTVTGNAEGGGRDNGYREVGRRYKLTDLDAGIPTDVCARVKVVQERLDLADQAAFRTPADTTKPSTITLDLPAIGLFNRPRVQDQDPCVEGSATVEARVQVSLPTYSRANPQVPTRRFPTVGWVGTSFTWDSAKWSGGGTPGKGDVARQATYPLAVPEYDGTSNTAWDAVMEEHLAYLSPVAYTAVLELRGVIDLTWWGLGVRLQVLNGPEELATTTELDVLAVEWDLERKVTRLYAGTTAAGEYDLQAMRREMLARHNLLRQKVQGTTLQQIQDCLATKVQGAGQEGPPPSSQLCADQVHSGAAAPGNTVKEDLVLLWWWEEYFWTWWQKQKGFTIAVDDAGNKWVRKPNGQWYYTTDDGATWKVDGDNAGPAGGTDPGDIVGPDPVPDHPDDLGPTSIEGAIWASVKALAAFLAAQKGYSITLDPLGNLWVTKPDGSHVYTTDGGATWKNDVDGDGPASGPEGGDTGAVAPYPDEPSDLDPDSIEGQMWAAIEELWFNKAFLELMLAGLTPAAPGGADPINKVTAHDGSVYTITEVGATLDTGPGLAGPDVGGSVGQLGGKCNSTFDGAADFGSGPGAILEPGSTVGADGAYYHPSQDLLTVIQLDPGDKVPASSQQVARAVGEEAGLHVHAPLDPGGPVFVDEAGAGGGGALRFWRCDPVSGRMEEQTYTVGAGLNGGDYSPAGGTYHEGVRGGTWKRAALVATDAALPANARSGFVLLTASAPGALPAVDGVTLVVGDRLLVKDEADPISNGLYWVRDAGGVTPWQLERTYDAATPDCFRQGLMVYVRGGTLSPSTLWALDGTGLTTPHTDAQTFTQWTGGGASTGRMLGAPQVFGLGGGTYTVPAGANALVAEIIGGGGGGGGVAGVAAASATAGGGSSGGRVMHYVTGPLAPSYVVTVGVGGLAGAPGGGVGGAGGGSTFDVATANGGLGGGFVAAGALAGGAVLGGAAGGVGVGGTILNGDGNPGLPGVKVAGIMAAGGLGACGPYGGGGQASVNGSVPGAGTQPGAGGGGATSVAAVPVAKAGGAGAPGAVIVWAYS